MKNIKTYQDVLGYLLAVMDFANDNPSKLNQSFTKEQSWNLFMSDAITHDTAKKPHDMVIKNILTEFPEYLLEDFMVESESNAADALDLPF